MFYLQHKFLKIEHFVTKDSNPWLLDSDASRNMTGHSEILFDFVSILPISIGLPIGFETWACHEGIVFSSNLLLRNVLYVPNLTCNLTSIAQLLQQHPS